MVMSERVAFDLVKLVSSFKDQVYCSNSILSTFFKI